MQQVPIRGEIFTGEASKIGFFSGKEKERIRLGDLEDRSNKFTVALFNSSNDKDVKWDKKQKWVPLNTSQGIVKVEIASLANRFGLNKQEVIDYAEKKQLDNVISTKLNTYKSDSENIKDNLSQINTKLKELKNIHDPSESFSAKEDIKTLIKKIQVKDPLLQTYVTDLQKKCAKIEEKEAHFGAKIQKELTKFQTSLPWSESISKPREKISEGKVKIGNKSLDNIKAQEIPGSPGKEAMRLNLMGKENDNKGRFAIKTDGYLYSSRPEADRYSVPYSEDGKTWVLININSLSKRTGLSSGQIKKSAEDVTGRQLTDLVNMEVEFITQRQDNFNREFSNLKAAFDKTLKNYDYLDGINDKEIDKLDNTLTQFVKNFQNDKYFRPIATQFANTLRKKTIQLEKEASNISGYAEYQLLLKEFNSFADNSLWWKPSVKKSDNLQ